MKIHILHVFLVVLFLSCQNKESETNKKINYPSHNYTYVNLDTASLKYKEIVYVPVYSDIYHLDGTKRFLLTATVSVRNISLKDSAFVLNAVYNDSYGKLLRSYTTAPILLKPLESIEFVIEDKEDKGGAGASFIVEWGGSKYADQLLFQAVMIGTTGQQGISFTSKGEVISRTGKR
jgi:lysine/ornithine N-monooxygenase